MHALASEGVFMTPRSIDMIVNRHPYIVERIFLQPEIPTKGVARSRQVGIQLIVEAPLTAVYLGERMFKCTFDLPCCLRLTCHMGPAPPNLYEPASSNRNTATRNRI